MRNLLIGIGLGIVATLALGAATGSTPGRYQIAATATSTGGQYVFRMDTQTGATEVYHFALANTPTGTPIQIIQPR